MDSIDRDHTTTAFDTLHQEQLKLIDDRTVHEYADNQDGISRSSSFAILVDSADMDISPISPLSESPSLSIRIDDNMSEVSALSPYTPMLDMSPTAATPQKSPLRELESPSLLSPSNSILSLDPFIQSSVSSQSCDATSPTASKSNFRTKAKGLSFKIPSPSNYRSGQSPGLLDIIRQREVSPLPSPLARDLRRRVEAHPSEEQEEVDITASFEEDSIFSVPSNCKFIHPEESCLGLDLGLEATSNDVISGSGSYFLASPPKRQETTSSEVDREGDYGYSDAKIMKASIARSTSAELVSSPSNSQARQQRPMSSLPSTHESMSKASTKKYPRKSIPLPPSHIKSPFAPLLAGEQDHSAYMLGLRTLQPSLSTPDGMAPRRDSRISNLFWAHVVFCLATRFLRVQSANKRLVKFMQGASRFPKYFPEGYLLDAKFARQYCLETELGSGGYGFVLSARHIYSNEQVAVKFINRRSVPTRGLIRDYKNDIVPLEAVVLQLAEHPGVVRFYGIYEDVMYFYLVQELHGSPWSKNTKNKHKSDRESIISFNETMKLAASSTRSIKLDAEHSYIAPSLLVFPHDEIPLGPRGSLPLLAARPQMPRRASYDLFECIEQHERLSEGQAKYIFAQVVETVWYLDSIGITHRDIKDENLVIDREFKVKFIDFGSAVIRDVRKPPPTYTSFFGTVTFASPEILKNLPYTAPPAEVWTLGILLSFLVTGQSPFPTTEHAMHAVMCEPHESIVVSPTCGDLMRKCLNPDPARRFTIQQVRDHPWLRGALGRA